MTGGVRRTLTIGRPADELLATWQLPTARLRVFAHLAELSDDGSRWVPRDGEGTWEVEVVEPHGDGRWQWRGHTGRGDHVGVMSLREAPDGFGTEVTISVDPVDDAALPPLFTSAALFKALHRFKSLAETGEITAFAAPNDGPDRGRVTARRALNRRSVQSHAGSRSSNATPGARPNSRSPLHRTTIGHWRCAMDVP